MTFIIQRFSMGPHCPSCGSPICLELQIDQCQMDHHLLAYTRVCPICQIDPFPAYAPGDLLEAE